MLFRSEQGTLAPTHTGAQPAHYEIEGKAIRPLGRETDKAFVMAARATLRRAVSIPRQAYTAATAYLADTLDWLNLWQDNADNDHWFADDFSAKQDRYFPQP